MDSEKKRVVLDRADLVGSNLCQSKNDCKFGGFLRIVSAPKIEKCLTIENFGNIEEHKTFKRFNYNNMLLDRSQYFKMMEFKKMSAMLLESCKKTLNSGVILPAK